MRPDGTNEPGTGSVLGTPQTTQQTSSGTANTQNNKQDNNDGGVERAIAGMARIITQTVEPLIMFVGPADCGKSMVMMSLVEYLQSMPGYSFEPNPDYNSLSSNYAQSCSDFKATLTANANVPQGGYKTPLPKTVDEVLLDVRIHNTNKYSMLEAPGEDFFSLSKPEKPLKPYLRNIVTGAACPIYYVLLMELHTANNHFNVPQDNIRPLYEQRLMEIMRIGYKPDRGDRVILLYNKIDLRSSGISEQRAMSNLFSTFYTKIKSMPELNRNLMVTRVARYEELGYVTGDYTTVETDYGKEKVVYRTTPSITAKASALWTKLR